MERVEVSLVVARREDGLEENGDKCFVWDERRVCRPFHQFARHEFAAALSKVVFRCGSHIGYPIAAR